MTSVVFQANQIVKQYSTLYKPSKFNSFVLDKFLAEIQALLQ